MGKWIAIGAAFLVLLAAGVSAGWWAPPFWDWLGTDPDRVQSLTGIVQAVFTVLAFVAAIVGILLALRRSRNETSKPVQTITLDRSTVQGDLITAGRDGQTGGMRVSAEQDLRVKGDMVGTKNVYEQAKEAALRPLNQLPPPPRGFVGRKDELEELRPAIRERGAIISCTGMGGVGKTALALVLAHEIKEDYPDGQIFYDLRGADPEKRTPATPREAMLHVVASLAPEAKAPDDDATLQAFYCSLLDGKRVLLLMDNAASREQVLPLVPPASCTLLITTRRHFDLAGLYRRNLDELPPEDARALLVEKCPRVGDLAADLAERCGRLPLMLEKAAGVLNTRPDLSPREYLKRLEDAKARLALIEASLSLSYDCLAGELQARFTMLSVFAPGSAFGHAAGAAVWGVEPDAAKDALGELLIASLVQYDRERDRYRMHDLVRDFAQSRLSEADRAAAEARHAEHYKDFLATANDLFLQGGEKILEGLGLFDGERENVEAGWQWAKSHAEADETAARLCSAYPDAGIYVLALRQHPRDQIGWLESAVGAARKLKDRAAEGAHLGNLGIAYQNLGETHRAIEYHEQAIKVIGNKRAPGSILGNLGSAYAVLGKTGRAIEYYEKQLVIAREIGDRRGEGPALCNLGNVYAVLGKTCRAIEYYEKALAIDREIGDRSGEGITLYNMANEYAKMGEREKSIPMAEAALAILEQIEDPHADQVRRQLAEWKKELE